jgi:hypothetical protein
MAAVHEITIELDERDRERERYAVYVIRERELVEVMATETLDGVGPMLKLLRDEQQIDHDSRIGVRDKVDRMWLINPYAKGAR